MTDNDTTEYGEEWLEERIAVAVSRRLDVSKLPDEEFDDLVDRVYDELESRAVEMAEEVGEDAGEDAVKEYVAGMKAADIDVGTLPDFALEDLGERVDAEREARGMGDEATDVDVADAVEEAAADDSVPPGIAGMFGEKGDGCCATDEDGPGVDVGAVAGDDRAEWRMEDSLVLASDYETVAEYAADEETSLVSDVSYAHGYAYATFRDELPDTSPLDVNSDVVAVESVDYSVIDGDVRLGFEATADPDVATDGGEDHPWEPDVGRDHPDHERDPLPREDRYSPGGGGPW